MYERLLDKNNRPSKAEFYDHCDAAGDLLKKLDAFLAVELKADSIMRFPYGNSYGWSYKYTKNGKLLCDVFAEKGAFTVMLRLTNAQYAFVYADVSAYTKAYIDKKYPCSDGGWIHYRVLSEENLADIELLLHTKLLAGKAKATNPD